jgi:branched-chain amino acid transport system substrate-binding protein
MSYESSAEPIRLGYLFDFRLPDGFPQEQRDDLRLPFELVFADASSRGSSTGRWRSCSRKSKGSRRAA